MNNEDIEKFVEILYDYFLKRLKSDGLLMNCVKRKNASVKSVPESDSNIGLNVDLLLPYDEKSFQARNETGAELSVGDLVCIEYSIDLKNAVIVYKINST